WKRKLFWAALSFLIALNFKLQAIILFPPFLLFMIYQSEYKFRWKILLRNLIILALIQFIILLPFVLQSQTMAIVRTLNTLGGQFGQISLNAGNLWQLIIDGGDLRWMSDRMEFSG